MWHKPCRTFHPWCLCIKTRCLSYLYLKLWKKCTSIWWNVFDRSPGSCLICINCVLISLCSARYIMFNRQCSIFFSNFLFKIWLCHNNDVIKWKKKSLHHWPLCGEFTGHRWILLTKAPVNSPHKGQWRGALMFSLIYASTNGWVNNREADDLRCRGAHYDVTVMRWHPCYYFHITMMS